MNVKFRFTDFAGKVVSDILIKVNILLVLASQGLQELILTDSKDVRCIRSIIVEICFELEHFRFFWITHRGKIM